MKVIKPFFGKFQPDLYIIDTVEKGSTIVSNIEIQKKQDILKEFREIDPEISFSGLLISGVIRFAIRGNFEIIQDKKMFEVKPDGRQLLTCVWWKDGQRGIDAYQNDELYLYRTFSSAKTSGYDYCITNVLVSEEKS